MAQVNVTISGKKYRMACDDGEEERLVMLAEHLNRSIEALRERFGEIGDQRLTVMAAITFADQQAESEQRLRDLEAEITDSDDARAALAERQTTVEAGLSTAIDALAERVEALAARLNGGEREVEEG